MVKTMMEGVGHNGVEPGQQPPVASVATALDRVIDAGQRILTDHIDLIRLELRDASHRILSGAVLVAVGGLLACGAWFFAMAAAATLLADFVPMSLSLLTVALFTAVVAAICTGQGVARTRAIRGEELSGG